MTSLDWKTVYATMHERGEADFPPAGLYYVLQLSRQASRARDSRPVTPNELYEDFSRQTRRDFGPMAPDVLEEWSLNTPGNFGRAVVLLGRHGCLTLEPSDTIEAFEGLETIS